jgi:hypothetical protein
MPDEAVLDAPSVDAGAIDTGATDTGSIDTSTSTSADSGASGEQIDNSDSPQSGETGHLRGAELYRAVKEKLKQSGLTPAEQRSLRNAIHIAAKADAATGGDLGKFETERAAYQQLAFEGEESLTPEDLVATVRGDREQLQSILSDIASGAPRLLDEMVADNPESFKLLVPQAMDKLAELDNPRFSHYVAKSTVNYLQSQGIATNFGMIDAFLPSIPDFPGKNQLINAIQGVYKTISGLETLASKQIDAPTLSTSTNGAQNSTQNGDLDAREQNVLRMEWNQTAGSPNVKLRDEEMTRAATARKITLTDAEKTEIKSAVKEEFETRLAGNPAYGNAMQGFLRNRNQRAYADRAASEGKKLLPSIVARHTNAVIDKRTKAAASAKPVTNGNGARPQAQPVKDGSGNLVQWLSGPPKTLGLRIDHMRSNRAQLERGEGYIIGEKALHKWKVKSALSN